MITLTDDEVKRIASIVGVQLVKGEDGKPAFKAYSWPQDKVNALKEAMLKAYGAEPWQPTLREQTKGMPHVQGILTSKGYNLDKPGNGQEPAKPRSETSRKPPQTEVGGCPRAKAEAAMAEEPAKVAPEDMRVRRYKDDAGVFWATPKQVEQLKANGSQYGEISLAPVDGLSDRERLMIATLNPSYLGEELVKTIQRVLGVEPVSLK